MSASQGIETIRRLAVALSGLNELADDLEGVASLEGMAEAAKAAGAKANEELAEAKAKLAAALDGVTRASDEGKAIIIAAQSKAADIEDQANHNAQDILAKAKADGEQAAADLKAEAAKSLVLATAERDGLVRQSADLKAEAAELSAKRDEVAAELADKQAALDKVNAAIAALRG